MSHSSHATIPIAVVGASGYSGTELIRILLRHKQARLACLTSRQFAGRFLVDVYPRFRRVGDADTLRFAEADTETVAGSGAEIAFLALPHGVSSQFAGPLLDAGLRVIDLSDEFRVQDAGVYEAFRGKKHQAPALLDAAVYGLPEIHGEAIQRARLIAAPGCYPTGVLLPLIPLLRERCVDPASIAIFSISGVSGAGRKAEIPLLFAECTESLRAYGAPGHRHLAEIEQELSLAAGCPVVASFTPHLAPATSGLLTTIYLSPLQPLTGARLAEIYANAYQNNGFVRVLGEGAFPDTKHVTGTNFIDIGWVRDPRNGRLVLLSAEDNLGKGAAGQAVQCMNIMAGFPETAGLLDA